MSADNWTFCPRCTVRIDKENNEKMKELYDQYGVVPLEEWEELKRNASFKPNELTFREDFDIGVGKGGTFIVDYRGFCKECNLSFNYEYSRMINMEEK